MCGPAGAPPHPNINMVADMGGGGMMMAFGIVSALLERSKSGRGQVLDAAMVEGTALLAAMIHAYRAMGKWAEPRGENILDGGAPFYNVYETADGGYMAVGSIEPQFYALLVQGIGLDLAAYPEQHDRAKWPEMKAVFAEIFKTRPRAAWEAVFDGTDACVTPVLTPDEAAAYPHLVARGAFTVPDGAPQPMPVPKFSRTPGATLPAPPDNDPAGAEALREWGLSAEEAGWIA
jgi:alpha-methylacyl-CoA racemase